ncbi:cationic amino acid transporter 4, vacuolar-like [Impatiens glandulifera]|uniref:cationic amino acid transporter 4, vacuolar-like n=1 Tax=Impatiens glandulifera TaxID=253017 RepID=UPI001FB13C7F|nr:cationic amino acid transporter 4, vacuolar-like [Impatiens glandulifera]
MDRIQKCRFQSLIRRKRVDSVHARRQRGHELLPKRISVFDLIAIGVGSTIGAGVYILIGTVAREDTGPALTVSFLIAGLAAALSAFCYAELACRCPSAGSAYHYSYICVGEGVAWLIGWALILEYTIGGSAVARGISPNLAWFFGGQENLPAFLARKTLFGVVVDPCAATLVLIVTGLLCAGIKESSTVQAVVTSINVCAMVFITVVGAYLGFTTGWKGYKLPSGYSPFGVNGIFAGSAIVFFSYIGFDAVTSTAEEVKNPQRDLPLGMGIALLTCCTLYMLVSSVLVGLVPYYALDPDTPISSAFASLGMEWAGYIVTTGAVTALLSSLLGSILPQPRVLMAMARDGLLPSFFSDINEHTQVPVKGTIVTGIFAAALAFFMDVSQLAGMVSVGTLLAFTIVAISVLILRYNPPDVVPLVSSFREPTDSVTTQYTKFIDHEISEDSIEDTFTKGETSLQNTLILKGVSESDHLRRRNIAAWSITFVCIGILVLACAASTERLSSIPRFILCGVGSIIMLCSLIILACIDQDDGRHNFGHTGGFICPFVPYLPVACILVNTYLLVNLGSWTWISVSIWLAIGALVYLLYGRTHSSLRNAVYIPTAHADEIYRNSS